MKKIIYILPLIIFVFTGCFNNTINENTDTLETTDTQETNLNQEDTNSNTANETVEEIVTTKEIEYTYEGELVDVTEGVTLLEVNTAGASSGKARAAFNEKYHLIAEFKNLPDPNGTDFYEGWIVRQAPDLDVISTGKAVKENGVYVNVYKSDEDLLDHDFYVLTLEPDDGNPDPAEHILEGTLELIAQ